MSDSNLHPIMQGVFAPHMPEVAKFTLDTSGEVRGARLIEQPDGQWRSHWAWPDLDAFTQGAFEAALRGLAAEFAITVSDGLVPELRDAGFADLHPEALVAILKDCAAFLEIYLSMPHTAEAGESFWRNRQLGVYPLRFPPLTVSLGVDGKVHLTTGAV